MATSVTLGVRLNPSKFQRIKIENVNLDSKVDLLKDEAAKKINVQKQTIELIYCGIILDDDATLSACGIKPGVMVHVLRKKEPETPVPVRSMSAADVQQLVVAFRAFTLSFGYRAALQRLSRPEVLQNIIATTPGLSEDPVAIAMIQDPELLVHMSDPDTVRRIAELHPSLAEAANHIAAAVHEEASTTNPNQPGTSSGYSYSLEALSDDEEMDSSSSDGVREGQPLSRNQSYSAITSAQLAAALANATNNYQSPSASTNSSASVITNEMFTQAMQQAFASVTPQQSTNTTTSTTANSDAGETLEAIRRRLAPQLQQMREMGLTNDGINVQALQATSGDVQAAIDLVFSGVISAD
ncbi:hypothetical protein CBL_07678 [Carabus blaptoides fortunei]